MRMNISVPDDLAIQVRALNLPISSICQQALRNAVEAAGPSAPLDPLERLDGLLRQASAIIRNYRNART